MPTWRYCRRRLQSILFTGLVLSLLIGFLYTSYTMNVDASTQNWQVGERKQIPKSQNQIETTQNHLVQFPSTTLPQVGFQRDFWIARLTEYTSGITPFLQYKTERATLLAAGEHGAIFFTNGCISILGEANAIRIAEVLRDAFDSTIYPRVTDLAGHPNGTRGDIDGDPRIYILLSQEETSFYSGINERANSFINPYSNECEMFYIYYQVSLERVIAHEFHHLILFNTEVDEQQFTLEGLACYASYYSGYLTPWNNLHPSVPLFLDHPQDSLLYWNFRSEGGLSVGIDYAGAYLLAFYIAEQYGVDILRNLIQEPADGSQGIEAVLQAAGNDITFNELYLDWITALTLDEPGFANSRYGFTEIDAQITRHTQVTLPHFQDSFELRYYGINVHRISSPSDAFTIQIQKPVNSTIGLAVAFHDTVGWHVLQHTITEGFTTFTYWPIGTGIDDVYIITSYISPDTPLASRSEGLGPTIPIELTTSSTLPHILYPLATLLVLAIIIIPIVVYSVKTKPYVSSIGRKVQLA